MLYGQDRDSLRRIYLEAWRKRSAGLPMEPAEIVAADAITRHPEYHALFEDPEGALQRDWLPEVGATNPFLHLSLHVALAEQVAGDRPAGIRRVYQELLRRGVDPHEAEHRMADCLAEALWLAQRHQTMPNEAGYLACLRGLLGQA